MPADSLYQRGDWCSMARRDMPKVQLYIYRAYNTVKLVSFPPPPLTKKVYLGPTIQWKNIIAMEALPLSSYICFFLTLPPTHLQFPSSGCWIVLCNIFWLRFKLRSKIIIMYWLNSLSLSPLCYSLSPSPSLSVYDILERQERMRYMTVILKAGLVNESKYLFFFFKFWLISSLNV